MRNNPNQSKESLANEIWKACDILRRDNNCGGVMEYVEHLSWLLFLKFLDAHEDNRAAEAKLASRKYDRILDGPWLWENWANADWPKEELLRFVKGQLIPHLEALNGTPERDIIRSLFADRNVIVCDSPYNLKDVIDIVDAIDFLNKDDIFTVSHVYEDLLRKLGSENRLAGEFYTPRPVVRFMVDVIDPQIGETIYDPACGTCGFLAESYHHMVAKKGDQLLASQHEKLQRETFYGQEKISLPALLGLMNIIVHGVFTPNIHRKNTLEDNIRDISDRYDIVLTNPPFGGTENKQIQQNFPIKANATELLFLQHIMKRLKMEDGARCAMVVPEGTLFRAGAFADVKKSLLEDLDLFMVVSLPPGTFAPYSDVKTGLLFFRRPGPTKEIWYYELPIPENLKKFSKGHPIQDEHFEEARRLFPARKLSDRSWLVPADEIKERAYDLTARNPNRPEDDPHREPVEIVAGLMEKEREILSILEDVSDLLESDFDQESASDV